MLHLICQQIWKTQQWPQDWKGQFSFQFPRKAVPKNAQTYHTVALIFYAYTVMLKILQAWLQRHVNHELQMFRQVLEKAEEPEIKLPTSVGSLKKQELQKNIYFCFINYAKAFDCVDHNKLWEILKEMGLPDHHLTCLLRNLYVGQEASHNWT